jgi:coenzyme F420-reducing hydrogenase gamma subunit
MMIRMKKLKAGFYGITGCAGCLLSVVFNEDDLLEITNALHIVSFPLIKEKNSQEPLDICFIEGTIVSNEDAEIVKKLRERSKIVVALGACACSGNIPAIRNFVDNSTIAYLQYEKKDYIKDTGKPMPLHMLIKVDFSLPGCPPDREEIKTFIKDILIGKEFRNYPDPVCRECRLFENGCLLDYNKICLGPLIRGGCKAVCPTNGFECYGCRGITDDANFNEYFTLLESKGISATEVKKHMDTFVALEVHEKLSQPREKWEQLH